MTFIAVRCPRCQSDQIVKRGKTARRTQRYLCQNTLWSKGSFLPDCCNRDSYKGTLSYLITWVMAALCGPHRLDHRKHEGCRQTE